MGGEDRWRSAGAVKTCSKHGETLSVPKNCVILMILQISLRSWWESSRSKKKDESSQGRCLIGIIQVQPSSTTRKIAKKHRSVSWLWQIKPKEETQSTETLSISLSSEPLNHNAALLCAALVFCFFFLNCSLLPVWDGSPEDCWVVFGCVVPNPSVMAPPSPSSQLWH